MRQKPSSGQSGSPGNEIRPDDSQANENLRLDAVDRLSRYLSVGEGLIARCEEFASQPGEIGLAAVLAAARVLRANAHVASVLAQMAQVERRQRSIIQRLDPPASELNARKKDSVPPPEKSEEQKRREGRKRLGELERRLKALTDDGEHAEWQWTVPPDEYEALQKE